MGGFIKKNRKEIISSILTALGITIIYIILKMNKFIIIECTIPYLNPWQYFFQCNLYYEYHYLIVFSLSFIIAYFILKKLFFLI